MDPREGSQGRHSALTVGEAKGRTEMYVGIVQAAVLLGFRCVRRAPASSPRTTSWLVRHLCNKQGHAVCVCVRVCVCVCVCV